MASSTLGSDEGGSEKPWYCWRKQRRGRIATKTIRSLILSNLYRSRCYYSFTYSHNSRILGLAVSKKENENKTEPFPFYSVAAFLSCPNIVLCPRLGLRWWFWSKGKGPAGPLIEGSYFWGCARESTLNQRTTPSVRCEVVEESFLASSTNLVLSNRIEGVIKTLDLIELGDPIRTQPSPSLATSIPSQSKLSI